MGNDLPKMLLFPQSIVFLVKQNKFNFFSRIRQSFMRYEIRKGKYNNYILKSAHPFSKDQLKHVPSQIANFDWRAHKIVILAESAENPIFSHELEQEFKALIAKEKIKDCIIINPQRTDYTLTTYKNSWSFLDALIKKPVENDCIYLLGNDMDELGILELNLADNPTPTNMHVDLNAISSNIDYYVSKTNPKNMVMAMVKANAYGHGLVELSHHLKHKVDYFGVAYVKEGITLRMEDIKTPIMVMNPSLQDLELCISHELEPEIHNIQSLQYLSRLTDKRKQEVAIQLEINTGMNRLGIDPDEIDKVIALLRTSEFIKVNGQYSHLTSAEDPNDDEFTKKQLQLFWTIAKKIETSLEIATIKHIRNSAGTLRFGNSPTDMVRLGLGIYGVDSCRQHQDNLRNVSTLKTKISQIRTVAKGETIGYNRTFQAKKEMRIATIAIGYADGFRRLFSNEIGKVMINGSVAPVVGRVNMDMTMVDVSGIDAQVGGDVIIFDDSLHVTELAQSAGTIPYEIYTSISVRVGRIYTMEMH